MLRRNALLLTATAMTTRMQNKLSTGKRLTTRVLAPKCTLYNNSNNSGHMLMMKARVGVLSTTPASKSEKELLLLDHNNDHDHDDDDDDDDDHYSRLGKRDWDKPSTVFKRDSWSSYPTQRFCTSSQC